LQLVEPARAGKILSANLDFGETEFEKEFQYMRDYNQPDHGVVITSFAHMESPEFFGCGAGHSHIYIDGSGEVSPCNMIPISYGNAAKENISEIIARMQSDFEHACRLCLAQTMHDYFIAHVKQAKPAGLETLPPVPFPKDEKLPRFFQILEHRNQEIAGAKEIVMGYNSASATYEDYWLSVASGPIDELFEKLEIKSGGHAIDCGCGTGYASAKLSQKVGETGKVIGIDLSPGMIEKANNRIQNLGISNTEFRTGDVLDELKKMPPASFNAPVLTWLIGYVGCWEIFPLLLRSLKPGGILGFVAHLDRSPLIPIEVFEELSRKEPQSLMKAVKLKFPKNAVEIEKYLNESGLRGQWIHQDGFDFVCTTGQEVYDHVMKSGAGTTFYFALRPSERKRLAAEFVRRIEKRFTGEKRITIRHEYVVGIGYKD